VYFSRVITKWSNEFACALTNTSVESFYRSAVDAWLAALLDFRIVALVGDRRYLILVKSSRRCMVMLCTGLRHRVGTMGADDPLSLHVIRRRVIDPSWL